MKKEITIAVLSAVALILFLGSASYLLFPQVSVQALTASIDVYTQHGGQGKDRSSGNFTQTETVLLYVEVRNSSNLPQGGRFVSFEIHWPVLSPHNGSIYDVGTSTTNASGIAQMASIPLALLQDPKGIWLIYVTTSLDNQLLVDTLTFSCIL